MSYLVCALVMGVGATATIDLWAIVRRRYFGIPLPDYRLVGRWFAHLTRGRFRHGSIAVSAPVRGEHVLGWVAHYVVGVTFAALLLAGWGLGWVRHPMIGPALLVGIGTVVAPFMVMQPGMGAGVAASRTPRPGAARVQSLVTHTIFGLGLYVSGWGARLVSVA